MEYQKRFIDVGAQIKALGDSDSFCFEGYGSVFGNVDSYGDVVVPGAFDESLRKGVPSLLLHHDMRSPVGIYTDAICDDVGLKLRGQLNKDVQAAREAFSLMKQGALKGLSIGFIPKESEYDSVQNVNRIIDVELIEVSIVTMPANDLAQVTGVKSAPKSERELEFYLRDAGFSRKEAKTIVSCGYKALKKERDADESLALLTEVIKHLKENT